MNFKLKGKQLAKLDPGAVTWVKNLIENSNRFDLQEVDKGAIKIGGWDGFPVRLYAYAKQDADGTGKPGLAAMLNPDASRAARWIVSATIAKNGKFSEKLATTLNDTIVEASGYQFVVRGIHWENMNDPGIFKAYPFFDGVTVKLSGIPDGYVTRVLSETELEYAIGASVADVTTVGTYARIQSTTPQDYKDAGGKKSVDGTKWLEAVRLAYQDAWDSDSNLLLTAKALAL